MADVTLEITIKDQGDYLQRATNAFWGMQDKLVGYSIVDSGTIREAVFPNQGASGLKEFGERIASHLMKQAVRMWEMQKSVDDYRDSVKALPSPSEDVPDDIFE